MEYTLDFTCDNCGCKFVPENGCYIGPKDRESEECDGLQEFEYLCVECNKENDF